MVRIISWLVGLGFCGALLISLVVTVWGAIAEPAAPTAEHEFHKHPKELSLASNGVAGKFDRQQLQRGLQVYKEVCAACHSLNLVAFRDLKALGYTDGQVKTFAKDFNVPSINPETGEAATRPATPADRFPAPFANDVAARAANNNAIPPDLSLMAKARHDGPAYIYSLLTGYQPQPAALLKEFPAAKTPQGLHYNPYFPNLNLAMAPPLTADGQVTYADGTKSTVSQMAKDVAAFLVWTAEPKLEARHSLGFAVVGFLIIFVILSIGAYRAVWADTKH
jgi:ubiquinol-cytochrome c reductase cytochrome c1 subunit